MKQAGKTPLMYKYLDRSVCSLEPRDRMLLWAMRKWVLSASLCQCPCATLAPAFQAWRIGYALPHFALVMFVLNTKAQTRLILRTPCVPRVGDDEARLLALFDAGANRQSGLVASLADTLVPAEASRELANAVELVSSLFAATASIGEPGTSGTER